MSTAIESGVAVVNFGRQAAKGTKAVAATTTVGYNRPKWQDGKLQINKKLGKQEYIDGNRFASAQQYTDMVAGDVGSMKVQLQPENIGLYYAQICGVDTVTGASDPYTHTITSAGVSGGWDTFWQKVGSAVGPIRQMFWDAKISKFVKTTNFADKVMMGEINVQALTAEVFAVDPAKTEDASDSWLHTEGTGTYTVDGLVMGEVSESILDVDTLMTPYFGDDIFPKQLIEGKGLITRSMKSIFTDASIAKYNLALFNTATPSAGQLPVKDVFYAAMSELLTRSATRTALITTPRVSIDPENMDPAGLPNGGAIDLTFTGECLKNGATPALTIVVLSADATTYA